MAATIQTTGQWGFTTTNSVNVIIPTGTAIGDLLVVFIYRRTNDTYTPASGWTLVHRTASTTTTGNWDTYWKIATSTETGAGGSISFGKSASSIGDSYSFRITGHDAASPIDSQGWDEDPSARQPNIFDTTSGGSSGVTFSPSNNSLILFATCFDKNSTGVTVPSAASNNPSWTEQYDVSNSTTTQNEVASATAIASGTLNNVTVNGGSSTRATASYLSIKSGSTTPHLLSSTGVGR